MDSILPALHAFHAGPGAMPQRTRRAGAPDRTVAITYGTYDLFHIGHVRLFERIKQRFGTLIVAVSTDEFNAVKGKRSNRAKKEEFKISVIELYEKDYRPKGLSVFAFYQSVARTLPDYVSYSTVLGWIRTPAGETPETQP